MHSVLDFKDKNIARINMNLVILTQIGLPEICLIWKVAEMVGT